MREHSLVGDEGGVVVQAELLVELEMKTEMLVDNTVGFQKRLLAGQPWLKCTIRDEMEIIQRGEVLIAVTNRT